MRRISSGWIIFLGIFSNSFSFLSVIKYASLWLIADMFYYILIVSGVELCGNAAFLSKRVKEIWKDQSHVRRYFQRRFTKFSIILGLSIFGQLCRGCFGCLKMLKPKRYRLLSIAGAFSPPQTLTCKHSNLVKIKQKRMIHFSCSSSLWSTKHVTEFDSLGIKGLVSKVSCFTRIQTVSI